MEIEGSRVPSISEMSTSTVVMVAPLSPAFETRHAVSATVSSDDEARSTVH